MEVVTVDSDAEGLRAYSEAVLREVYRIAREEKRSRSTVERTSDLAHDVFLRIEPYLRRREPVEALVPLAATIARRLLIDYWKKGRPQLVPHEFFESAARDWEDAGIRPGELEEYLETLDEDQRRVIDLRLLAGYSQRDIAHALDASEYFVAKTLKSAEARLRTLARGRR